MPLIIIAAVLIIALLIYGLAGMRIREDKRPVKERYPEHFKVYDVEDDDTESNQ